VVTQSGDLLRRVDVYLHLAWERSDKISHIDIQDDRIDTVISHIISHYPISISRMTISIWWMTISIYHIPYRYPIFHIDTHIEIPLMSDIPYRYPISISHIDIPIISCHSAGESREAWREKENKLTVELEHILREGPGFRGR